jgi:hypothetical protein
MQPNLKAGPRLMPIKAGRLVRSTNTLCILRGKRWRQPVGMLARFHATGCDIHTLQIVHIPEGKRARCGHGMRQRT